MAWASQSPWAPNMTRPSLANDHTHLTLSSLEHLLLSRYNHWQYSESLICQNIPPKFPLHHPSTISTYHISTNLLLNMSTGGLPMASTAPTWNEWLKSLADGRLLPGKPQLGTKPRISGHLQWLAPGRAAADQPKKRITLYVLCKFLCFYIYIYTRDVCMCLILKKWLYDCTWNFHVYTTMTTTTCRGFVTLCKAFLNMCIYIYKCIHLYFDMDI